MVKGPCRQRLGREKRSQRGTWGSFVQESGQVAGTCDPEFLARRPIWCKKMTLLERTRKHINSPHLRTTSPSFHVPFVRCQPPGSRSSRLPRSQARFPAICPAKSEHVFNPALSLSSKSQLMTSSLSLQLNSCSLFGRGWREGPSAGGLPAGYGTVDGSPSAAPGGVESSA